MFGIALSRTRHTPHNPVRIRRNPFALSLSKCHVDSVPLMRRHPLGMQGDQGQRPHTRVRQIGRRPQSPRRCGCVSVRGGLAQNTKNPFALSLSKCPSILSLSKGLSLSKCPSILSLSKGLSLSKFPSRPYSASASNTENSVRPEVALPTVLSLSKEGFGPTFIPPVRAGIFLLTP